MKLPKKYGDDSYQGYCTFDSVPSSITAKQVQAKVKDDTKCSGIPVPAGTLRDGGCKTVAEGGRSVGACYTDVEGAPWACIRETNYEKMSQVCNDGRMKLPKKYQQDGDDSYLGYCSFEQSSGLSMKEHERDTAIVV